MICAAFHSRPWRAKKSIPKVSWKVCYQSKARPGRNRRRGGGGIRTHGPLRVSGFQDRCNRPLYHPSKLLIYSQLYSFTQITPDFLLPFACHVSLSFLREIQRRTCAKLGLKSGGFPLKARDFIRLTLGVKAQTANGKRFRSRKKQRPGWRRLHRI